MSTSPEYGKDATNSGPGVVILLIGPMSSMLVPVPSTCIARPDTYLIGAARSFTHTCSATSSLNRSYP